MNNKAVFSGNISLLFALMILGLLIIFTIVINAETKSDEAAARYAQIQRGSDVLGGILYHSGWLANSYANYVIEVDGKTVPFGQAITEGLSQEKIQETMETLESNTRLSVSSLGSVTFNTVVIRDHEILHCTGRNFDYPTDNFCDYLEENYAGNNLAALEEYIEQNLDRANRERDSHAQMNWAVIPGEQQAIIGVAVW